MSRYSILCVGKFNLLAKMPRKYWPSSFTCPVEPPTNCIFPVSRDFVLETGSSQTTLREFLPRYHQVAQ